MSSYEIMLTLAQIKDVNEKDLKYKYLMSNPDIIFDWLGYDKMIELEDSKPDPNYYFICGKCGRECSSTKPYYKYKKNPELYICKDCRNPKKIL